MKKIIASSFLIFTIFLTACSAPNNPSIAPTAMPMSTPSAEPAKTLSTTMNELKTQNNLQCTHTFTSEKSSGITTVYMDQGKIRSDTNSIEGEHSLKAHVLIDGEQMYIWQDGQKEGMQVNYIKAQQLTEKYIGNDPATSNLSELNKKYDFKCKDWIVDPIKFIPPTDVTFTDMTKQLELLQSMPPIQQKIPVGATNDACGACNQLTGEKKTQCLQILKC